METKLSVLCLSLLSLFACSSCNDGDESLSPEETYTQAVLPESIMQEIKTMYPDAIVLSFEKTEVIYEIAINDGTVYKNVIFDIYGEWVRTEWDIQLADVPAVVWEAYATTDYTHYPITRIEIFENSDGVFYAFKLELEGDEVHITIQSDGTILNDGSVIIY